MGTLFSADSLLLPLAVFVMVIAAAGYAGYRVYMAPRIAEERVAGLLRELAVVTQTLNEAERLGHFGSFAWDVDNPALSYWSEEMYSMFGLVKRRTPPELDIFISLAAAEDKARLTSEWHNAKARPGLFSFTFRAVAPDSSARHVRVQGTSIVLEKRLRRLHGAAHDITSEVQIDRSKSEFVSLASHQLKTPLTSIRWLVEALMSGSLGPIPMAQKAYLELVQESVQRMIVMVNDLLTVSRIEMNKLARHLEDLDAVALFESVLAEQKHDYEARQISLTFTREPDIPRILADVNSLRMVFQNLISNAIKYTPKQGSITCAMSMGGASKEAIYFTVTDSGIGIPAAEHSHVFEKLHRASNAQALVPDGTGLGLYVVKTVLDRAGGGISFESTENKGTTFYVTIPIHWREDEPILAETEAQSASAGA